MKILQELIKTKSAGNSQYQKWFTHEGRKVYELKINQGLNSLDVVNIKEIELNVYDRTLGALITNILWNNKFEFKLWPKRLVAIDIKNETRALLFFSAKYETVTNLFEAHKSVSDTDILDLGATYIGQRICNFTAISGGY